MYRKFKQFLKEYIRKDFTHDKFDGNYPFNLDDIPFTKYKSFGEKNSDKVFYVIYRTPYEAGFFSNFMHVIFHLKLIEGTNLIPIVDFQNFKTFYNNEAPIYGTENSWEYYFEQLSPYSLDEVYKSKHVLFCGGQFPHKSYNEATPEEICYYYNKVFRVKKHVSEILAHYEKIFEQNRVLGIHFRGKDMNKAAGHSFAPTEKQMIKYTDEILEKYSIDKIFIATDEKRYLDLFIKKYSDKLFYSDNFRIEKVNEFNISPRENHRYLLGLEVLIDTILLSKCNGILCGASSVSYSAKHLNPNMEFEYYIDNGKNVANKYQARYLYHIKKRLPKHFGGLCDKVKIVVNGERK